MKILIVTNMYPTKETPYYGIFVSEQEEAIRRFHPDVEFGVYNIRGDVNKKEYIKSINGVYDEITRGQYDLVHIHYGLAGLFLLNPFRKISIPIIITLHGGDIQPEQGKTLQVWITKKILKHVNFAITLNKRMDDVVRKYTSSTAIIPCSINTDLFCPNGEEYKTKEHSDITIVFPSSHKRTVKNYPLFQETLKKLQELYGIQCKEIEINNMTRTDIVKVFRKSNALLMTSISEGSPQVVKEAMACNLPVISTKVGDVDILLKGVKGSGWVYPHDATLLAEKIHQSLNGEIGGILPREKIFQLGIDDKAVSDRIYNIYLSLLK